MALPTELVHTRDEATSSWRRQNKIARGVWAAATAVIGLSVIIPLSLWARDVPKAHAVAAITDVVDDGEAVVTWDDGATHEVLLHRVLIEERPFAVPSPLVVGAPVEVVYDAGAVAEATQPANLYPAFVGLAVVALWVGASMLVSRLRPSIGRQSLALLAAGGPSHDVTGVVEVGRGWGEGDTGARILFWTEHGDRAGSPSRRIQLVRRPADSTPGRRRTVVTAPQPFRAIGDVRPGGAVVLYDGDLVVRTCDRVRRYRGRFVEA